MLQHPFTNNLIDETSPYLLQHAHNPVNWTGWNNEAFKKAKAEDKLVIVSIGYSACHWCHVMEHESFEDTSVAAIMNEHFVCIKVDREERPDVDQIYMDAVQLISGRGGWPLNAIVLPDGRPVYAGTYYPKDHWKQVLMYFVNYWKNKREEALERANEITQGIKNTDAIVAGPVAAYTETERETFFAKLESTIDYERGGRGGAPKFPMPVNYRYLLRNAYHTGNEKALKAAVVTLDNMMNGGIYDQMGGGFARYSVDAEWEIPHFEKMLYDNSQLVSLYAEAYQVTKNDRYKQVVQETCAFIERELSDVSGGFYSALDADSEGEEGKFYVWSYDELKALLGAEFESFIKVFDVSLHGNFEGRNNLVRRPAVEVAPEVLAGWRKLLMSERAKRVRPGLDDKILTSWNALMLSGYVQAYKAFGEQHYLDRAINNADFLKTKMLSHDFSLKRNYKNGNATINGFLDDYSFTCQAFIDLYQVTFNEGWLQLANGIAEHVIQYFSNASNGLFFYTSLNDDPLIARKTESSDNVIPASNSSMAIALFQLGSILGNDHYVAMAKKALDTVRENMMGYPGYYANWAILMGYFIEQPFEVAITGPNALALNKDLQKHFLPDCNFMGSVEISDLSLIKDKFKPEQTWIYVCQDKTCALPVENVEQALSQIQGSK